MSTEIIDLIPHRIVHVSVDQSPSSFLFLSRRPVRTANARRSVWLSRVEEKQKLLSDLSLGNDLF